MEREMESKTLSIVDLNAELAKLTMFRGRTPQSTMADRKGSAAQLASYRDGALLTTKFAGKGHWGTHPGDELIHILDGTALLEIVCDDGPPKSFALRAGMMAVIPQGAWHRFHSSEGATLMTADALSRREDRPRCRRPSDGRARVGMSNGHDGRTSSDFAGKWGLKLRGGATGGSIMMFEETVPAGQRAPSTGRPGPGRGAVPRIAQREDLLRVPRDRDFPGAAGNPRLLLPPGPPRGLWDRRLGIAVRPVGARHHVLDRLRMPA